MSQSVEKQAQDQNLILLHFYGRHSLILSDYHFDGPCIYRVSQKKVGSQKYVYCSEGHKNQANQILILCMFFSTLGHLV